MANVTGLAAARHEVLRRVGWDVEQAGLAGAPAMRVLVGAQRHTTIERAVRLIGLGSASMVPVAVDDQGRMRADALAAALAHDSRVRCQQHGRTSPIKGTISGPISFGSRPCHRHQSRTPRRETGGPRLTVRFQVPSTSTGFEGHWRWSRPHL